MSERLVSCQSLKRERERALTRASEHNESIDESIGESTRGERSCCEEGGVHERG